MFQIPHFLHLLLIFYEKCNLGTPSVLNGIQDDVQNRSCGAKHLEIPGFGISVNSPFVVKDYQARPPPGANVKIVARVGILTLAPGGARLGIH